MKLLNTLTRQLEEVVPLHDNKVSLYTCGLTVYSHPHIGNWVPYIYWDVLVRVLNTEGYEVVRVQNITDVGHLTSDEDSGEDKMLKSAQKEGLSAWDVAEKYINIADDEAYHQLGLLRPDYMPRATKFIHQQIDFVKQLEQKGYTYIISDGVYFDTSKLSDYGKLAQLDIDGLKPGARIENQGKKNPTDFALWKFSDINKRRDMEWWAPWSKPGDDSNEKYLEGIARYTANNTAQVNLNTASQTPTAGSWGFPGWHLECSAMARELLGDQIDIHAGGIDHIPIHHTNEIAQTEALTSKSFANIWIHANHMKVNGTKMSKSLDNIYTLSDITSRHIKLEAFKLMVLSKHYRTEGNFTWEILKSAQNRLKHWQAVADTRWQLKSQSIALPPILEALSNDIDTPKALALIDSYFDKVTASSVAPAMELLQTINSLLGINLIKDDVNGDIKDLISQRTEARDNNDWQLADQLRDKLLTYGIEVRDTSSGQTIWSRT